MKDKYAGYWEFGRCEEEASKYNTYEEFREKSNYVYNKSKQNYWLDEICSHMIKPKSYWTKPNCKHEAHRYRTLREFENKSKEAYQISIERGWLEEICSHMKIGIYLYLLPLKNKEGFILGIGFDNYDIIYKHNDMYYVDYDKVVIYEGGYDDIKILVSILKMSIIHTPLNVYYDRVSVVGDIIHLEQTIKDIKYYVNRFNLFEQDFFEDEFYSGVSEPEYHIPVNKPVNKIIKPLSEITKPVDILGMKLEYTIDNFSGIIDISEERLPTTRKCGVYFLYSKDKEIIYIGKSVNCVRSRLRNHLFVIEPDRYNEYNNSKILERRKESFYFSYTEIVRNKIDMVERYLIPKYNPKFNEEFIYKTNY